MPKPVPAQPLQPYLAFKDASAAIDFYQRAFDATELYRMPMPDGRVGHAELRVGGATFMLSDEWPDMGALSAEHFGGTPVGLALYVEDVDAFVSKAVAAGATVTRPVQDQFYGDRSGVITDPFHYKWTIGTHIEDVSPEEMNRRMAAFVKQGA